MKLADLLLLRELEPPLDPAPGLRGPKGDKGDPGLVWRGAWRRGTDYAPDDAVEHKGSSYVAIAASTGSEPPAGSWDLLAKRGDDGMPGMGFRPAPSSVLPDVIDGGTP